LSILAVSLPPLARQAKAVAQPRGNENVSAPGESAKYPPLPLGLSATSEKVVPPTWTLAAFDPKLPPVLSTPAMIGLMEVTAAKAVQPSLPTGCITVGTRIEVDHLKAVSEGAHVTASAKLVSQEGRFLVFEVEARSGTVIIGRGRVFRAIIEPKSFTARSDARTKAAQ
jgi:fluoroacetyl-CoA thioesterase